MIWRAANLAARAVENRPGRSYHGWNALEEMPGDSPRKRQWRDAFHCNGEGDKVAESLPE